MRRPPAPNLVSTPEMGFAVMAFVVGVLLLGVKFAAYVLTDSAAIFSDATESIVNVAAAGFMVYAVRYAHRPADATHPYGHGKVEFIAAATEGGLITAAAAIIALHALAQFVDGTSAQRLDLGIVLIAFAGAVNGAMGLVLVRAGRRSQSITLEADGRHLLTDAVTSLVVLITLPVVLVTGWNWLDPVAAMLIAAWMIRTGLRLIRRGIAGLMDEQDAGDDAMLRGLLDARVGTSICSYHKLRHRHHGRYHWIDFHLCVPGAMDVETAHRLASEIEYEIEQKFEQADATAHVEPCDGSCSRCGQHASVRPPVTQI
jgi:cation diffusion facilitator family transporter